VVPAELSVASVMNGSWAVSFGMPSKPESTSQPKLPQATAMGEREAAHLKRILEPFDLN